MNPTSLLEALQPMNWPFFALVSARVVGMMLVAPLWSTATIPGQMRGALALVLSLAILPTVHGTLPPMAAPSVVVPMMSEFFLGLAIGLAAAAMMYSVTIAAEVITLQMGLSLGAAFGGPSDVGTPGIGQLYHQLFLVVFVTTGGPLLIFSALARSFTAIAPGVGIDFVHGGTVLVALLGGVFSTAIQVAAPVMVALLVTNLALAVLNRAIPQLNTMMVAVPLTVAVGFIAIGGALPLTSNLFAGWVGALPAASGGLIEAFTHRGP